MARLTVNKHILFDPKSYKQIQKHLKAQRLEFSEFVRELIQKELKTSA